MTTAVVIVLVVLLLFAALRLWVTANRLDRLHVRTEAAWFALEGALARRIVATRAVAAAGGLEPDRADGLRRLADIADHADRRHRADAENDLSRALSTMPAVPEPDLAAELADAGERVLLARRFYNDAVRDTRALRAVWFTRIFGLAGRAAMPDYFEIAEYPHHPAMVHRTAARVVVVDKADRILLLSGTDPQVASHWWHTPGGGVENGEALRSAAVRELAEETGFRLPEDALLGPIWRRVAQFTFLGSDYEQTELYFVAPAPRAADGAAGIVDNGDDFGSNGGVSNGAASNGAVSNGAASDGAGSAANGSAEPGSADFAPVVQPVADTGAARTAVMADGSGSHAGGLRDRTVPGQVLLAAPPADPTPAEQSLADRSLADQPLDGSGRTPVERITLTGHRWWSAEALAATDEAVYPVELPHRLPEAIGILRGAGVPGSPTTID